MWRKGFRSDWVRQVTHIDITALSTLPPYTKGAPISAVGDAVFIVAGGPTRVAIDAGGNSSNFIVTSYGRTRSLLVNEIGPYAGTVVVPSGGSAVVIEVIAGGPWSMTFS